MPLQAKSNLSSWLSAAAVGLVTLTLLFWLVDSNELLAVVQAANWYLLALAILPLIAEVTFTSLRVQHCVNHPVSLRLAMYSNSLYIAWLSLLPARLGEIAGVAVFHQKLKMPIGSAMASVVVQRIYDVLILAALLVALLTQSLYGGKTGLAIAAGVLILLMIGLVTLPVWLDCSARLLHPFRQRRWLKRCQHILLQARTWYRHQSAPSAIGWLAATTFGKWCANLVAVSTIFLAVGIELELVLLATVGILMHFFGAIPLQSFGGFGATEIGLAGILISLGVSAEQAVAAGLLLRLVFLVFAVIFFVFCFVFLRPKLVPR